MGGRQKPSIRKQDDITSAFSALGINPDELTYRDEANAITHQTFRSVLEDFHQWLTDEDMRAINVASSAALALAAIRIGFTNNWDCEKEDWPVTDHGVPCPKCQQPLRQHWRFCPRCGSEGPSTNAGATR